MGQSHSRDPDDVCYVESLPELLEMFPSPSDIPEKLSPVLFWYNSRGNPQSILNGLSQISSGTEKDSHISEEWLEKSLLHLCPGFDDVVTAAVPVLYKIILHHSTYPFKPLPDTRLTPVKTAIAVALLTANDTSIMIRELLDPDWPPPGLHLRTRDWKERTRLLFQSLCNTDWTQASKTDSREMEDDEDLIAVIGCIVLHRRQRKVRRPVERYFEVAKTMPSSYSRKLDGTVSLTDIRALLALMIVVSAGDRPRELTDMKTAVETSVDVLSSCFPNHDGRIGWEEFQQATAGCMPLLLTELAALISSLFPMDLHDWQWYPPTYSWRAPLAIAGNEAQSKKSFLTMPQLSQLGLVIRRQELDTLRLLRKDEPKLLSSLDISNLFNHSPEGHILLLVGGRVDDNPLILACTVRSLTDRPYTPPREQLEPKTRLSTVETDGDCVVQLLPTHRVFWGTSDCAQVKTITADLDDLLIDLGKVKLRFAKGLDTGKLESGSETVPFTVELMEVWGR